jgi:ribosomal protein L37AE/L43A
VNRYQQAQGCPGCGGTEGVELTRTTPRVTVWKCTRCGLNLGGFGGQSAPAG